MTIVLHVIELFLSKEAVDDELGNLFPTTGSLSFRAVNALIQWLYLEHREFDKPVCKKRPHLDLGKF